MCGIAGFIGESKNANISFELTTKLFSKSEIRGTDAAGFWGTESGEKGDVFYHKEPIKSSSFIKHDLWKQAGRHKIDLMLTHARGASKGVGIPHDNINNHPFVSSDKSLALIHNGRIEDYEYNTLKEKYEVLSNCDSEILLRILEAGEDYQEEQLLGLGNLENLHRMAGIKDIYSLINDGHMAVAVGERQGDGSRLLWLFRNRHRPLWVSDMRETLGQIFFVSEPNIWEDSVSEMKSSRFFRKQKLIEIPEEEVWYIKLGNKEKYPSSVQRFEVCKESTDILWNYDGNYRAIQNKNSSHKVITKLSENDRIVRDYSTTYKAAKVAKPRDVSLEGYEDIEEFSISDLEYKCKKLQRIIDSIETNAIHMVQEQSITRHDFDQLLSLLEQQANDLQSIDNSIGY